ncbi:MAG: AAA family ATPase [Deltaproteobacteria bacterium]|nr:AAA family ATPase [Deltaproteobacteria bacterium]
MVQDVTSARSRSVPGALPTEVAAPAAVKKAVPGESDVFVEDGRLVFKEPIGGHSKDSGLGRAKKMLQIARAESQSKMSFGGRVAQTGIDPAASLRNYYPSLRVARELGRVPEFLEAIIDFADQAPVPTDLRPLLRAALELKPRFEAEKASALGTANAPVATLVQWAQSNQHNKLLVSDAALSVLVTGWWQSLEQALTSNNHTPETALMQARIFARVAELGLAGPYGRQVGNWSVVAGKLPATEDGAKVFARLLAANGEDLSKHTFQGKPVGAFASVSRTPKVSKGGSALAKEIGTYSQTNGGQYVQDARNNNVAALAVNDASIPHLVHSVWQQFDQFLAENKTPETSFELLKFYVRARELGHTNLTVNNWQLVAQRLPQGPGSNSLLRRAARAFQANVPGVTSGGSAPKIGEKALGASSYSQYTQIQQLINAGDISVFKLDDPSITVMRQAYTDPYYFGQPTGWDKKEYVTGALELWARAATLGQMAYSHLQHFVQGRIPASLLGDREVVRTMLAVVDRAGMLSTARQGWSLADGNVFGNSPVVKEELSRLERLSQGAQAPMPSRRGAGQPRVKAGEPLGKEVGDANTLYNQKSPKFLELSDAALAAVATNGNPSHWMNQFSLDPRVIRLCARIVEISGATNTPAATSAKQWLNLVPWNQVTPGAIPEIARLAKAAGVPFESVKLQLQSGHQTQLVDHPDFKKLVPPPKLNATQKSAVSEKLQKLDPSALGSPSDRRTALEELVLGDPKLEVRELLELAISARASGELVPVSMSGADAAQQSAYVSGLISAFDHLAASSVLLGAFAKVGAERVESALVDRGFDPESSKLWAAVAERLAGLDARDLKFTLAPVLGAEPEFSTLPMRLALAESKLTDETLAKLFDTHGKDDALTFADALLARTALEPSSSPARAKVAELIKAKIAAGDLSAEDVRDLVTADYLAILEPDADKKVDDAVAKVIKVGPGAQTEAIEALATTIKDAGQLTNPTALASRALGQLIQSDLARVLPLDQADAELGGVGPALFEPKEPFPPGTPTVMAAGIELAKNDRVEKDKRAVPKKAGSELVMTETTHRNVKLMAAAWRLKRPVLLEGPTSSGKTSAVRYLAHLTDSPYRRINLSYYTDVSDLLGKYVGGEKRFDKVKLDAMEEHEFSAHAAEYGIEHFGSRAKATEEILQAQTKARWVDGPVIRALKRGEVLLLDEMNLARPEVLERLNSLFDDDGNVVLTEHHNEVVKPDKNFRLFATMNPASYSGRARLSDAMRSRWTCVFAHGLTQADLTKVMTTKYGEQIPADELAKLVAVHDNLSRLADEGEIGHKGGGVAFTLRNLFRASERFLRYRNGDLDDAALMRRETEELYAGGLFDAEDRQSVQDILQTAMPYDGPGFYDKIELTEDQSSFSIGDISISKLGLSDPLIPKQTSRLVMTPRTKEILYRMAKALDMGENVALIGERASGKTAIAKMFAMLREQPYHRQLLSGSTDAMQLVGGYDDQGWKDGLLLDAGRPDGKPGVFLGDEFNLANPALLERLNSVLDDERKLVLAEKEGEEIKLHPDFRFVAAMNPPTKEYGGRAKLSKAMQNRFTMIAVPNLDDPTEQKLILKELGKKLDVPEAITETLTELQAWIRKSYEDESLGKELRDRDRPVYSIRQLINAATMIGEFQKQIGAGQAYLLAIEATYGSSSDFKDNEMIMKKAQELAA